MYPTGRAPASPRSAKARLALVIQMLVGAVGGFYGLQWLDSRVGGLDVDCCSSAWARWW